jgi:hypothetical protein
VLHISFPRVDTRKSERVRTAVGEVVLVGLLVGRGVISAEPQHNTPSVLVSLVLHSRILSICEMCGSEKLPMRAWPTFLKYTEAQGKSGGRK